MNTLKRTLSVAIVAALASPVYATDIAPLSIGGEVVTDPSEAKFYAQVKQALPNGTEGFCGGSILDSKHILTAAHCVDTDDGVTADDVANIKVLVGSSHRMKNHYDGEFKAVKSIHIHENWKQSTMYSGWDIAILELEHPITDNVQSITLPTATDISNAYAQQEVFLFGLGIDESQYLANDLEKTNMYPIPEASLGNYACSIDSGAESRLICTTSVDYDGGDKGTTCGGDSGGPLTYLTNDGVYQQIGLVSYGPSNAFCGADWTSHYTNIQTYVDSGWIDSVITNPGSALNYDPTNDTCQYSDGDDKSWKESAAVCEFEGTTPPTTDPDTPSGNGGDSGGGSTGLLTLLGLGFLAIRRKK